MRTDQDLYNFTMAQFIWHHFPDVEVTYAFKCRTPIDLTKRIDETRLRAELEFIKEKSFSPWEIVALKNLEVLEDYFVDWLVQQPLPDFKLEYKEGQIELTVTGPWITGIFWETPILYTINNLAYSQVDRTHDPVVVGMQRLQEKVAILQRNPQIKFFEFGTRRRYSHSWQFNVLGYLQAMVPENLMGTSNVYLGSRLQIPVRGTIAHQLYMVNAALELYKDSQSFVPNPDTALAESIKSIDDLWHIEFAGKWDGGLMIALPDTFGSDYYFELMHHTDFNDWRGFRQDSGDPFVFGDKVMHYWGLHGIDPKSKLLVFSDGLDIETMLRLCDRYCDETSVAFGWGTNLTNDVGFEPLSMVVKPILANGAPCVKLSDNIAKATGDLSTIKAYKQLIQYSSEYSKKAMY